MSKTRDDLGLALDMLDADKLRHYAEKMEIHGSDISHWADRRVVIGRLRDIAGRIETTVREVGTLRGLARQNAVDALPPAPDATDATLDAALADAHAGYEFAIAEVKRLRGGIRDFIAARGKHDGDHGNYHQVCGHCEEAYVHAESALDGLLGEPDAKDAIPPGPEAQRYEVICPRCLEPHMVEGDASSDTLCPKCQALSVYGARA